MTNADSEFSLGGMLFNCNKYADAFSHFIAAAKLGHPAAQTQVGAMYAEGWGIEKNSAEAIRWTQLAVNQGYPMAESNLGNYYRAGFGVPKDIEKAISLYELASVHGDDYSPYILGTIYEAGESIPKSKDKAYSYFILSAERGYYPAIKKVLDDTTNVNLYGSRECKHIVKKEFSAFFSFIRLSVPVEDTYIPQETFNEIVAVKRRGQYVQANRLYMDACCKSKRLSSNVANAWLKVLAASGDVEDAIKLGDYVLSSDTPRLIPAAWMNLEINSSRLKELTKQKAWSELAALIDTFAGSMGNSISISDIDVANNAL